MTEQTDGGQDRRIEARQSFTGRSLTQSQFDEAWALSEIIAREIHKSGSFREKLSDYAHAFARSERFDALRGEEIIRDIFRARYGETMNHLREGLTTREKNIENSIDGKALGHARFVNELIRTAPTMPFYQAYDRAAVAMATAQGITKTGAKAMMKAAFATHEGRELYEAGKETEALYHKTARQEVEGSERKSFTRSRRQMSRS